MGDVANSITVLRLNFHSNILAFVLRFFHHRKLRNNITTLPIAMIIVGTASMMIPASIILKKLGQRKGFMLGTVLDVLSGFILGILHR